jgi:hypothetical protein
VASRAGAVLLLAVVSAAGAVPASAQSPERFTFDTTVEADVFRGGTALDRPNIVVDIGAVVRLGAGWTAFVRPWFRQARTPSWDKQIYQASLQYEHAGPVSTRVDLGYIASPIGLGMMDSRPGIDPTILPHLSYFTPMPAFDTSVPRVVPIASTYPLGGEITVSTTKWDARAAFVDTAPTRVFVIKGATNPPSTPALEAGVGVTPKIGLRIGASLAHGEYAAASEIAPEVPFLPGPVSGRGITLVALEGEYTFGYTKLSGELVRDAFETSGSTAIAYEWFVQGAETLSPRWFVAARQEGTSAPPSINIVGDTRKTFQTTEATVGYRLSPELTFRASFYARKAFTTPDWDQQGGIAVVWAHRWW